MLIFVALKSKYHADHNHYKTISFWVEFKSTQQQLENFMG